MPGARLHYYDNETSRPHIRMGSLPLHECVMVCRMRGPVHQRGGRARSTVTEPCMLQVQRSVAPTSDTDTEIELLCKERT